MSDFAFVPRALRFTSGGGYESGATPFERRAILLNAQLDMIEMLKAGGVSDGEISRRVSITPERVARLIEALPAMRVKADGTL